MKLSFDESLKGDIWEEICEFHASLLSSADREEASSDLMDRACARKFRTISHHRLHTFIERMFFDSIDAEVSRAGILIVDNGKEPDVDYMF